MTYTLAPGVQSFIDFNAGFTPVDDTLDARRDSFLQLARASTPPLPEGWRVDELVLGHLRLRRYQPTARAPAGGWPTVLYVHGGGWHFGDLDTYDWFVHRLAQHLQMTIFAVAYRLAPEHRYPAANDDVRLVWNALREGVLGSHLSPDRLAVIGDSSGGNLAAALCMALRRDGEQQPLPQALIYPLLTTSTNLPSMVEYANVPMITTEALKACVAGYFPPYTNLRNPSVMPLNGDDFGDLAPAFITMAEVDPL